VAAGVEALSLPFLWLARRERATSDALDAAPRAAVAGERAPE
jgi:hypothetical protein